MRQLSYLKLAIAAVIVWAKGALRVLRAAAHMTDIVEYALGNDIKILELYPVLRAGK